MKTCFTKLHKVAESTMDNIVSLALADYDWHTYADTYSSSWTGARTTPRYESTIATGLYDIWNEDMQFISDLILPKGLEPYVEVHALNKIPAGAEIKAHVDKYRECSIYLPIYPVKEKYAPMLLYHDNDEICIDNYDVGRVYLFNSKILHRVCNSTDLPRFNYQITLNKPYEEICNILALQN